MRTKDEILKQASPKVYKSAVGESYSVFPETTQQCILEVLLDIREMLETSTPSTILHGYSCGSGLHSTAEQAVRCGNHNNSEGIKEVNNNHI